MDRCLLDLGASVNLLPYFVYKQLGLGELQSTNLTLLLAYNSVKIPKEIVEEVIFEGRRILFSCGFCGLRH